MKQLAVLWLLLFHCLFFVVQFLRPTTGVDALLLIGLISGVIVSVPFCRRYCSERGGELAMLNVLLALLHGIWIITGVDSSILSFIGIGLIGLTVCLLKYFSQKGLDLNHPDLPFMSVVFAVGFMVLSQTITIFCAGALATDFDSQNYLTWAFTAYKNYLPYKDVVYWYGLFTYYAASIPSIKAMTVAWSLLIFIALATAALRVMKDKLLVSFFLLLSMAMVRANAGYPAFFRYGSAFALSVFSSYLLSRKTISYLALVLLGFVGATMMFLISDQGIYFTLIVAAQIGLRGVFIDTNSLKKTLVMLMQRYFWFGVGFGITWLAALGILQYFGALQGYLENIQAMGMMGVFAKVSLSQLLFSRENSLTTIMLFVGTQLFLYQSFFARTKPKAFIYLLNVAWLFILWLCQNKFLIRPWFETQFIFVTFALYAFQVVQLIKDLTKKVLSPQAQIGLSMAMLLGFFSIIAPDKALVDFFTATKNQYLAGYAQLIEPPGFTKNFASCLSWYYEGFREQAPQKYTAVLDWIATQPNTTKPSIFSFPGEPVFYLLHDQKPPAYFNAYDATSNAAQQTNLDYIKTNDVRYVIWDTDNLAIQDDVPNILRNNQVAQFIFQYFEAKQQVGNYLIFERTTTPDLFLNNNFIKNNQRFYESLTSFNLKFFAVLWQKKLAAMPQEVITTFTQNTTLELDYGAIKNLQLWLSTRDNVPVEITLTTPAGLKTTLTMTSCFERKPCLIPLEKLPLFFNPQKQVSVNVNTPLVWEAKLLKITPAQN